jgi:cob(I)alamin adenosyltransferase
LVKLNRIYTRTGDDGTTGLGTGRRVLKTDVRVAAYGSVDEANAALGVCVATAGKGEAAGHRAAEIAALLRIIQNDLFDVGADLCCPIEAAEEPGSRLRITPEQTSRLERAIDQHNERLAPLNSFVLPGGAPLAAALHVARTVTRRAERDVVALRERECESTNPETIHYLNRLSDLLFVLGRVANRDGADDVRWVPGAGRDGSTAQPA